MKVNVLWNKLKKTGHFEGFYKILPDLILQQKLRTGLGKGGRLVILMLLTSVITLYHLQKMQLKVCIFHVTLQNKHNASRHIRDKLSVCMCVCSVDNHKAPTLYHPPLTAYVHLHFTGTNSAVCD